MSASQAPPTESAPAPVQQPAQAQQQQQGPVKRSSRRANTAERRATHNAVERARRETLNGRFLDLAAMLPNLAAVRRPSKSAIVNSSIALIYAQRRHRVVAAREARLLKAENDALRQELNEWRQRSNLPRVEEPPRSADLVALLSLEDNLDMGDEGRQYEMHDGPLEDGDDYFDEADEDQSAEGHYTGYAQQALSVAAQQQKLVASQSHLAAQQQAAAAAFAAQHQKAAMARATHVQQQQYNNVHVPAQVAPSAHHLSYGTDSSLYVPDLSASFPIVDDKFSQQLFSSAHAQSLASQPSWSQKAIAAVNSMRTPPGSANGIKSSPFASTANQAFLTGYSQGNGLSMFQSQFLGGPGSVSSTEDDSSSVGSSGHDGSHFSAGNSPAHISLGSSPVDHQFSFGHLNGAASAMNTNTYAQPPQQHRPSVNIPTQAFLAAGPKQVSPIQNGSQQFAAMGLMM